jgi:hypothetical protein
MLGLQLRQWELYKNIMKTGVLSDPYGNSVAGSSAGSAPALDANHIYAYDCDEASGSTILVNKGSGANGNLTLQGTEGTHYQLAQKFLGRNTKCIRNLIPGGTGTGSGGAVSGNSCSVSGAGITIEIVACADLSKWNGSTGSSGDLIMLSNASEWMTLASGYYPQQPRGASIIGGFGALGLTGSYIPNNVGMAHIMVVFDSTNTTLKQYTNGALTEISTPTTANNFASPFTKISIGTGTNDGSHWAWFRHARISNIVRSATYASQTAEAFLAM